MKLREIRTLNENTQEGAVGALIGGAAGAALTKTPSGALTGAKIGSNLENNLTDKEEVDEGVMSEIHAFMTDIAENPDEGYDKIYDAILGKEGDAIRQYVQRMYDDISINNRLHPDDDFEEIVDIMIDHIEADFAQQESVEESKEVPTYAVRVGEREVTFEDKDEADRFISLARLGGIKAEAVTVTKAPAQPKSVVTTDAGQSVEFQNDQDAQQFAQKLKQGQASVQMEAGDDEEVNPVAGAITRRIINAHTDWLMKYGPEAVTQAIDDVAEFVGDVEEIGSSDVSGWVKEVGNMLAKSGSMQEKAQSPYAIGMAQAMKSTGDKPPLEKSTIKKAHEIAKKVMAKESEEGGSWHNITDPEQLEAAIEDARAMDYDMFDDTWSEVLDDTREFWDNYHNSEEGISESIEQVFEEQTYTIHVDNAHDFDLDDERGIDRALQTVFKDAGVNATVDPHDRDSTKAVVVTNSDIDELLDILDQNGINAHLVKESMTEGVLDDTDDSGFMAKSNLYTMIKNAVQLHELIQDRDELEGWVEEKITLAADYIKTVKEYLEYNKLRGVEQQPQQDEPTDRMIKPIESSNAIVDSKEFDEIMALTSRLKSK